MVDKPLPGCAEGCVLLLLDDSHPPALGIPVLGVYIFSPCCVAFARSSLSFFEGSVRGVFVFDPGVLLFAGFVFFFEGCFAGVAMETGPWSCSGDLVVLRWFHG